MHSFRTLFTFAILCFTHAFDYCPPLGPVYELPRNLSTDPSIRLAAQNFTALINERVERINDSTTASFLTANTSFSIDLFSAHDDESLFQYHFTAPVRNASSTKTVDENTIYRIGSISKVVTILALLRQEGKLHFDDPITKYIPELARYDEQENEDDQESEICDDSTTTHWSQITVGALASHLSGIGRTYAFADISSVPDAVVPFGFPALNSSDIPRCGRNASEPPCSRQDFLQGLNQRHPVYAPFTTPVYSNAAIQILGYVLENVTGYPYGVAVQKTIFDPLGLRHSSVSKPPDASVGVIPVGESDWDFDLGGGSAMGGIYMSTKDLSSLGRAILNSSLLRPAQTRAWLKPQTHTSSLIQSVGAPWEIYRVPGLTQDGRVIDLYTKSGGLAGYVSLLVLVPDYDIGLTLLVAADGGPIIIFTEEIMKAFIPIIEKLGKQQAAARYTGIYDDQSFNSSVEISIDNGPGLVIKQWISNNIDVIQTYDKQFGSIINYTDWRLYPTGLKTKTSRESIVSYRGFVRPVYANTTDDESITAAKSDGSIFTGCLSWAAIDGFVYGSIGVDDFVFRTDSFGNVKSIEPRVTRLALNKRGSASRSPYTQFK